MNVQKDGDSNDNGYICWLDLTRLIKHYIRLKLQKKCLFVSSYAVNAC